MDVSLKLLSESLLSFYPAMVKYIQFPIINQLWARLSIYALISLLFIDKSVFPKLLSGSGILLAITSVFHVWSSYIGFKNLESGVSYSIFYVYPLLIILLAGNKFKFYYLLPLIGVFLLSYPNFKNGASKDHIIGLLGIIGATLSEVGIYFIVKRLQNKNPWNTVLISYLLPAIFLTIILNKKAIPNEPNQSYKQLLLLILGNALIGVIGYTLRFYTINRLPSNLYGILSYFGIVMAYVYGYMLNEEKITIMKVIGSLIIVISALFFFQ